MNHLEPVKDRLNRDLAPYKSPMMVGHFLLPTVFLISGSLFDSPLVATTAATACAALAMHDQKRASGPVLIAAATSSLLGVWNSHGAEWLAYGANSLVSLPLAGYQIYLHTQGVRLETARDHSNTLYLVSSLFFPLACFKMRQILPPSFAAIGIGGAVWGALKASHHYQKDHGSAALELLPLAYGTAFAYALISLSRIFSESWSDKICYAPALLLHAAPFGLYLKEVGKMIIQHRQSTQSEH